IGWADAHGANWKTQEQVAHGARSVARQRPYESAQPSQLLLRRRPVPSRHRVNERELLARQQLGAGPAALDHLARRCREHSAMRGEFDYVREIVQVELGGE